MIVPTNEHFEEYYGLILDFFNKQKSLSNLIGKDDFWQELCMGYLKSCELYDEKKGGFSTYLFHNLQGVAHKMWRNYYKNKNNFSLNSLVYEEDGEGLEYVDVLLDNEAFPLTIEKYGIKIDDNLFQYIESCMLQFENKNSIIKVGDRISSYKKWLNGEKNC